MACPNGHPVTPGTRFCGRCGARVEAPPARGGGGLAIALLLVLMLGGLGAAGAGLYLQYRGKGAAGLAIDVAPGPAAVTRAAAPAPAPLAPRTCVNEAQRFTLTHPATWRVEDACTRLWPGRPRPGEQAWLMITADAGDHAAMIEQATSAGAQIQPAMIDGRPAARVTQSGGDTWVVDRGGRAFSISLAIPNDELARALAAEAAYSIVSGIQLR